MNRRKELREDYGWTQEKLGNMIQVQKSAVSKYEKEKISLTKDIIIKLGDIFDVSTDYLIGISDQKKETTQLGQSHTPTLQEFLELTKDFSTSDVEKIVEYAELLKLKENL